ncbi:MAG: DUF1080 domain-containing protein [Candidatus Hydrogenedentes bacterium]|nr:DUF1080 domain-containing protein [Candidatus Hydrogenedentota bacterium]
MRYLMLMVMLVSSVLIFASAGYAANTPAEVPLFNGKDFSGWKLFIPDPKIDVKTVWSAKDGVVHCEGTSPGYMRTEKPYENYKLTLEWRWAGKPGNNGVLLHIQNEDKVWPKSIEAQLQDQNAGDFFVIDGSDFKEHINKEDRRVPKKAPSNEKPAGEWNKYEIVCDGNTITATVNGLLQNSATEATITKGYIGLQSEGAPIEYRNIVLLPLPGKGTSGAPAAQKKP